MDRNSPFYKKKSGIILSLLTVIYVAILLYHQVKPLPEGASYLGDTHRMTDEEITFLYDLTYQKDGEEVYDHEIWHTAFQMIEEAEEFLIVDMFMINDFSNEARDFPELEHDVLSADQGPFNRAS
jgi:hypothetical protein